MNREQGFTLMEMATVIGIVAVISSLAMPPLLSWKKHAELRGSAARLAASLQLARNHALAHGEYVVISMQSDGYRVFVDNGEGGAVLGDWERTGTERLLRDDALHPSVTCSSTFPADRFRFKGFGRNQPGTISLVQRDGSTISIIVNVVGRIRLEMDG